MTRRAIVLFPVNWTAAVVGAHLAAPLLTGVFRSEGWDAEAWDLSQEFYLERTRPPKRAEIVQAARDGDCEQLDRIYFDWEDRLRALPNTLKFGGPPGLLSGCSFERLHALSWDEAVREARSEESAFTDFHRVVVARIAKTNVDVVAMTVASEAQLFPAVELLELLHKALPEVFLIVGGNVITRLRHSPVITTLLKTTDQVVFYQGEGVIRQLARTIADVGIKGARETLASVVDGSHFGTDWPLPSFDGIGFDAFPGTPSLSFVTTRGCYWGRCSFCAIPAGWSPSGFAGSVEGATAAEQMVACCEATGIRHVKLVDEAFPPAKIRAMKTVLAGTGIEWEAYARLDSSWCVKKTLRDARAAGLSKLYFGLEQAPGPTRDNFGKNDSDNPLAIIRACAENGIAVHLFCMVGHPRTTVADAWRTVGFLLRHRAFIHTADVVGFRLDRGTMVAGVRLRATRAEWRLSAAYEPTEAHVLDAGQVDELEVRCQEAIWSSLPRLIHPLYRLVRPSPAD